MTENSTSEGLDNRNILGTGWTNLKSKNWPLKKTSQHWDWQSLNSSNEMTENSTSKGPDDWNIWAQAEQTPKAKNWQLKNLSVLGLATLKKVPKRWQKLHMKRCRRLEYLGHRLNKLESKNWQLKKTRRCWDWLTLN